MSWWNYRIIKKSYELGFYYTIIEVSYDEHDNIIGWSEGDKTLMWNNPEDLKGTIELLQGVINRPILEEIDGNLVEINQKEELKND